jgi:hypothetical protein
MTHLHQPPRIATWLVKLFSQAKETDSVLGDLAEEFSGLASQSGAGVARKWYWRQTLKTLPHLLGSAFRLSPWLITAAVAGGFLLSRLTGRLPEFAIFSFVDRYHIYENHFAVYRFLASTGIDIGMIIKYLFVGCAMALAAKGNEMAAAVALGAIHGVMVVVALVVAARTGNEQFWMLGWYVADTLAIVIGGAIVRMLRLSAMDRPSNA